MHIDAAILVADAVGYLGRSRATPKCWSVKLSENTPLSSVNPLLNVPSTRLAMPSLSVSTLRTKTSFSPGFALTPDRVVNYLTI